LWPFEYHTCHC